MSEHQYYEFQAVDRPLSPADRDALRALSSRAVITARSFANHYEWGDLNGNPDQLVDRWFDLHLYLANWGTRRLVIRVPAQAIDLDAIEAMVGDTDDLLIRRSGDNVVFSIARDELEDGGAFWDDEPNPDARWLADMAPLRDDVLAGDLRLFYLLWLATLGYDDADDDAPEPLPGIGPLTDALSTFADFFQIETDLVAAAAERVDPRRVTDTSTEAVRQAIAALPEAERLDALVRLATGDPGIAAEFGRDIRRRMALARPAVEAAPVRRTAAELRARARAIRAAREQATAKREAERLRAMREQEAKGRRARLEAIRSRGGNVWQEIETEIERRNPSGYDRALDLLMALKDDTGEQASLRQFENHVAELRERHARKRQFVQRLDTLA